MYKTIAVLMMIVVISVILLTQNIFYKDKNNLQIKLLNSWNDNSLVKLTNLINENYKKVCALKPYQISITNNSNSNELNLINDYLKNISYTEDEGFWALVTLSDDKIELFKFERKKIDISYFGLTDNVKLPNGFNEKECVDVENGFLYLFKDQERKYIVLGDIK